MTKIIGAAFAALLVSGQIASALAISNDRNDGQITSAHLVAEMDELRDRPVSKREQLFTSGIDVPNFSSQARIGKSKMAAKTKVRSLMLAHAVVPLGMTQSLSRTASGIFEETNETEEGDALTPSLQVQLTSVTSVPVPAAGWMMLAALVGFGIASRRS